MKSNTQIDPSIIRKGRIGRDRLAMVEGLPLFSIVELNLLTGCNRKCDFCPVSSGDFYGGPTPSNFMSLELYDKFLSDMSSINYSGKILYSGFSEPLLHKELDRFIELTKRRLPESRVEIVSNGDLLTSERLKRLFSAGLDTISISLYDGPHQIEHFNGMIASLNLTESQVVLRRRYYQDGDYGLIISNRGGLLDSNKFRAEGEEKVTELPLKSVCYYPFYMTKLTSDGDVLICSHDWQKRFVVGSIKDSSLFSLWRSEKLNQLKLSLSQGNRNIAPCNTCDVQGDVMGRESFVAWREACFKIPPMN